MKIFKISLLLLVSIFFIGCTQQPEPRVVTITKEVEVYIPTKMKRPKLDCEFKGEGTEPIGKLLECLVLHKRALEAVTTDK